MNSFSTKLRPLAIGMSALLLILFAVSFHFSSTVLAAPDKTRTATEIIQFDDIDVAAREITFDTKKISGLDALKLSGFKVVTTVTQFGTAVCAINGVGQPADNCFGDPDGKFWAYSYWDGSTWQSYSVGADSSSIGSNAIEGWRWGVYLAPQKPAPPILSAFKGLKWLGRQQSLTDGGYGNADGTTDAQLAIGANDFAANKWKRTDTSPTLQAFQKLNSRKYSKSGASSAGKLAVAVSGSSSCFQQNSRTPADYYNSDTGVYKEGAGHQAWSILGTVALAQSVPANAVTYLKSLQQGNGGFEWQPGWGTDTNSTAIAIQALLGAGEANDSPAITNAVAYLATAQNSDGGFAYDPSAVSHPSDGDSTAWVVQSLIAAGENPTSEDWTKDATPIAYLQSLQLGNGSFQWQAGGGANLLATEQIIAALLGRPLVLKAHAEKVCK